MHTAVTGFRGFIGSHLTATLLQRGDSVLGIDRLEGKDVRTLTSEDLADCDVVFHLAAEVSVPLSFGDPELVDDVNVGGTIRVLEAAAGAGVRRMVLASSAAAAEAASPYGISKLAAERYLHVVGRQRAIETVALRFQNVYGSGGSLASVIPAFIAAAREARQPVIYGDGLQARDFVHVDDVVAAILLAAEAACNGLTIDIGSGRSTSLLTIWQLLAELAGVDALHPDFQPERPGDVRSSVADLTEAERSLGFAPFVALEAGLRELVAA